MSECICRGRNPECCFCNGTGYSSRPHSHPTEDGMDHTWQSMRGGRPRRVRKVKCPHCGSMKANLVAHIAAAHPKLIDSGGPLKTCERCHTVYYGDPDHPGPNICLQCGRAELKKTTRNSNTTGR